MRRFAERLAVIGPGVLIGAAFSLVWCLYGVRWATEADGWQMWGLILAGGLPASLRDGAGSCCGPAALLALPAIAAHPIRPNLCTGVVTAAGLAFWFLCGGLTVVAILASG